MKIIILFVALAGSVVAQTVAYEPLGMRKVGLFPGSNSGSGTAAYSCTVTAVSSIACTHNLSTTTPWVACYDGSGNMLGSTGASTSVTSVVATSANVATITFSGSTTGVCVISTGSQGPAGATGATGATGAAGANGTNGTNGTNGAGNNGYCADATGSTTTYTCPTPSPTVVSLTGLMVVFVPQATNTASSTLNVASLGAKTLKHTDGSTNLAANELIAGIAYVFQYDGTNFRMSSNGIHTIGAVFNGGGSALTAGTTVGSSLLYLPPVPYGCTVIAWTVTVDAGTVGFRVWRKAAGTAVPTVSDTLNGGDLAIASNTNLRSTTMTNFTGGTAPVLAANDILAFQLNAAATATYAAVSLQCQ